MAMRSLSLLAVGLLVVGCGGSGGGSSLKPFVLGSYTGNATGGNGDAYGPCSIVLNSTSAAITVASKTETLIASGPLYQGKYSKGTYVGPGGETGLCNFKIVQVDQRTVQGSIVFERHGYETYLKLEASR